MIDGEPSEAQRAALSDQDVSHEEYRAGFQAYVECLKGFDYELRVRDDTGLFVDFAVPSAAVEAGADQYCYEREFIQLDIAWQGSNFGSSDTAEYLQDCLRTHGVEPSTDPKKLEGQLGDLGISPATCT